ncbi:MAG TPA: hypothetical protein VGP26_05870 [Actinophytocola sp.]|jgi:hypothetical protein|nr:hypothetical protein [Actinophytocola sp.]
MSELLWVAVPSGLASESVAIVRVLVVPRLQAGSLADNGMQDWPAVLADAAFELRTKSGSDVHIGPGEVTPRTGARSEVWHAFFDGDAGVVNDWQQKTPPSPVVAEIHQPARRVLRTYQEPATTFDQHWVDEPATVLEPHLDTWFEQSPPPAAQEEQPAPRPPVPDFHQTVAMLREHPAVLRDLGLIFELAVDVADLDGGDAADRHLAIRCQGPPFLTSLVTSPWTRYAIDRHTFRPAGSRGGIDGGMLDIGRAKLISPTDDADEGAAAAPPRWALTTADVNGAVSGLRQAARAARDTGEAVLPELRTIGVALVRPGRQGDFDQRISAAATNAAADELHLTADDLVLGYRVDVKPEDARWFSLCERIAAYRVNGLTIGADGIEEGHVKPFAASKDPDGTLHADEIVVRWDGWSLALPAPSLTGDTPGATRNGDAGLPYDFRWEFTVPPGRLPTLRFANRYQLRVRIADVTGGGLTLDDVADDTGASDTIRYARNETVPPPQLSHDDTAFAPGAAIDRLVIRSDGDQSVAEFHRTEPSYPTVERRTISPPRAPFPLVEQHRRFDEDPDEQTWEWARRALDDTGLPDPMANGVGAFLPGRSDDNEAEKRPLTTEWAPVWPDYGDKFIELAEQTDPANPVRITWGDGTGLRVFLARAQQAIIELSSTLPGNDYDHLAVLDWLPDTPSTRTLLGRNPVVTPVRKVYVVHAVKRPLAVPRWSLPQSEIRRTVGATTADLSPTFPNGDTNGDTNGDPDYGLDTASTGQLEVGAVWREWTDDGERDVTVPHLHRSIIAVGPVPDLRITHEFGDTRHRRVTYTLTAVSRFRQYFHEDDPAADFQLSQPQETVTIPNTARPGPPVVLATGPSFRWQRTESADRVERTRLSRRVRVEVARPWYETGEGERLAVIAARPGHPAEQSRFVSQLGRDPVFATPPLPRFPPATWFAGSTDEIRSLTVPGLDVPVDVVPYAVTRLGDRWCADIELAVPDADQSYNPFVQLVVARFQWDSLAEVRISPVAGTDRVPLLPDRHLVVDRTADGIRISLTGTNPNPPNRIEATLERCDAGVATDAVELVSTSGAAEVPSWYPVPGATAVSDDAGTLPPLALHDGMGPLRVRVRETERLDGSGATELTLRTVFLDVVAIPTAWYRP